MQVWHWPVMLQVAHKASVVQDLHDYPVAGGSLFERKYWLTPVQAVQVLTAEQAEQLKVVQVAQVPADKK